MKHYHLSHSDNAFCRVVVTVPFGSGHEPADWPGLAHLLEHCLFLGSHKLEPGTNPALQGRELDPLAAGELQGIMAQAGIRINASTRLEQSCYMLECLPEQLEEAFLCLLQLIYAPEFHPQEVIAEVGIIDGEYQAYCEHPEQQLLNLAQQQVHPEHAFHTFSAGNRSTLGHNDPEILRQLHLA
ncbi:MAG: insulinase family protein, partial [Oceanospirillum sp.]|nr:insulinase family protein [Oceanospirillum sp.]